MSKLRHFNHARPLLLVAVAAIVLVAPQLRAAKGKRSGEQPAHEPHRLMAIVENGPIVTLRLDNGTDVDVAKSIVKIKSAARGHVRDGKKEKEETLSISQLSQMSTASSSGLPAVVSLSYRKDGNVKKAKIRVFPSEAEVSAFFAKRNERLAAAASQNKEPHR